MAKKSDSKPNSNKSSTTSKRYDEWYVPHLDVAQIRSIAKAAAKSRRGERDRLLVQFLFDGCLRVSEALRITPNHIQQDQYGWRVEVFGKWSRPRKVAISPSLAKQLQNYASRRRLRKSARFFPFTRTRAFQIIDVAMKKAGIRKPDHVGTVHVLRHSGALARLYESGNPKEVQEQLGHKTAKGTFRYFKTLQSEEAIQKQQGIDFDW